MDSTIRMVVEWQVADHTRTCLVIGALQLACLNGHLQPGAIPHQGREAQYASGAYAINYPSIREIC